jgi:hypothetical protein
VSDEAGDFLDADAVVAHQADERQVFGNRVTGRWRPRALRAATRGRGVRDLRLLRVFAVLRVGYGGRCPGFGGC